MKECLNFFLQCDMVYVNNRNFYVELAALGKATGETVGEALSKSGEFLCRLTDVGGIFCSSRTDCLRMAGDILGFIHKNGSAGVSPVEVLELEKLRGALMGRVANMTGSWNDLIRCAIDNDDTTVFHEISDIVWDTEETADEALFDSEDFLQSLRFKESSHAEDDILRWTFVKAILVRIPVRASVRTSMMMRKRASLQGMSVWAISVETLMEMGEIKDWL